jgi:hypothetical protein
MSNATTATKCAGLFAAALVAAVLLTPPSAFADETRGTTTINTVTASADTASQDQSNTEREITDKMDRIQHYQDETVAVQKGTAQTSPGAPQVQGAVCSTSQHSASGNISNCRA